ncbi:hypothetical protein PCL_10960 [Purpureocillium lilacinum]|uniref:Uncharacterized protein n=1 Tax=Purpureocillium lilacinum TaxID=33203 RepID=A0A2U3ECU3_PURLI|nr:hypothetical protein PCL_10960 [Purpureocillium lilacinum]
MMRAVAGDGDDRRGFRGDPVRSRVRPRAGAAAAGASAWPARSRGSPLGRMGTAGAGCRKREETAAVEVRGRRAMGGPAASAGRLVVVVVVMLMLMLMSGGRLGGRGAGKVRAQIENRKHLGVAEHGPAGTLHGRAPGGDLGGDAGSASGQQQQLSDLRVGPRQSDVVDPVACGRRLKRPRRHCQQQHIRSDRGPLFGLEAVTRCAYQHHAAAPLVVLRARAATSSRLGAASVVGVVVTHPSLAYTHLHRLPAGIGRALLSSRRPIPPRQVERCGESRRQSPAPRPPIRHRQVRSTTRATTAFVTRCPRAWLWAPHAGHRHKPQSMRIWTPLASVQHLAYASTRHVVGAALPLSILLPANVQNNVSQGDQSKARTLLDISKSTSAS